MLPLALLLESKAGGSSRAFAWQTRQRQHEDREFLDALLKRLPLRLRRVLLAYYEDDRTMEVIGALEGLTHERVRQLIEMALERLRTKLRFPMHRTRETAPMA